AYQYLETRYRLRAVGAISLNPEQSPGARRISAIKAKIKTAEAVCIFAEPQFAPRLVGLIADETGTPVGTLDPEGAALTPGPNLYFDLMRGLGNEIVRCLGAPSQ